VADLTTVDGVDFIFDPAQISAVADHDADTGEAATVIYGLSAGTIRVQEAVSSLLGRLNLATSFAKLTRPDGSPIWANARAVGVVRQPLPGEGDARVRAVLAIGALMQGVTESLSEVRRAVNQCGGKL
jgi:hypothetical protein